MELRPHQGVVDDEAVESNGENESVEDHEESDIDASPKTPIQRITAKNIYKDYKGTTRYELRRSEIIIRPVITIQGTDDQMNKLEM